MSHELADIAWPLSALERALAELSRAARLPRLAGREGATGFVAADAAPPEQRVRACAARLGLAMLGVDAARARLEALLERAAPALVPVERAGASWHLAVLESRRGRLTVLTPELRQVRVSSAWVREALTGEMDRLPLARVQAWLHRSRVTGRRARRARRALLDLLYGERRVGPVWLLRADPGSPFLEQLRSSGAVRRGAVAVALALGQVAFSLLGWLLLGRVALGGSLEPAWLLAWSLSSYGALPFQLGSAQLGSRALQAIAEQLDRRLLCGALRLPADQVRRRGPGRLLALASEYEAVASAVFSGASSATVAVLTLLASVLVLAHGAGGLWHAALVPVWCAVVAWAARRLSAARRAWTGARVTASCSFVEHVLGNRTRVAQQPPSRWHEREDLELRAELDAATRFDAAYVALAVLPARGWLLLAWAGLVPALIEPAPAMELALAIGGVMLAYGAFGALAPALSQLCAAWVSWEAVAELYDAARLAAPAGQAALPGGSSRPQESRAPATSLLHAAGLWFRHPAGPPVLRGAGLRLSPGDYVLLEGPSGGGKSTLASLLAGLATPERGHVLLGGFDRATLGREAWSRRIASAPQFHDNHVFSATLVFNLLMGRAWPPSESDRREAEAMCRALGLGPLLSRMPAGLEQLVGETGWQLSHGERSRLFLARALLQTDAVVVLDESLGALDPETARQVERAITAHARAALVIAHP